MLDEQVLIEKAKTGDRDAMNQLVRSYEKTIFNFAFKVCRNKDKAENTVQETYINVLKSLKQFDGNAKFSTWLYRIIVNNCFLTARNEKKNEYITIHDDGEDNAFYEPIDENYIPDKTLENSELKSILDDAVQKLEPEYKLVFILRDVEELSTEETAKVMNLSVPAVKSRLHRARKYLREELNKHLNIEKK